MQNYGLRRNMLSGHLHMIHRAFDFPRVFGLTRSTRKLTRKVRQTHKQHAQNFARRPVRVGGDRPSPPTGRRTS